MFGQITDTPKDALISSQYDVAMAEYQNQLSAAQVSLRIQKTEVAEYETEVIKIIRGESKLNADLLNKLHSEAKEKVVRTEDLVNQLKDKISESKDLMKSFSEQYEQITSWADMFSNCDLETKKMILARIMNAVKVSRDYEIEISFAVSFEQFGGMIQAGLDIESKENKAETPIKKAS